MINLIKNYKYYLGGLVVLSLIIFGMIIGRQSSIALTSPRVVLSKIEEIRRFRHLELVTYHFESMVDVAHEEKSNKVYLLLIVPSRVSCYIDLDKVAFHVGDTLVRISLPEPVIENPVLDLDSARVFNLNERYITASKSAYEKVVRNVQLALSEAKRDVLHRAEANGIKDETIILAKGYLSGLMGVLGYDVEFIEPNDSLGVGFSPHLMNSDEFNPHLTNSDSNQSQPTDLTKAMMEFGKLYKKAFTIQGITMRKEVDTLRFYPERSRGVESSP